MLDCRYCIYYRFLRSSGPDALRICHELLGRETVGYCTLYHIPLRELRRNCPGFKPLSFFGARRVSRAKLVSAERFRRDPIKGWTVDPGCWPRAGTVFQRLWRISLSGPVGIIVIPGFSWILWIQGMFLDGCLFLGAVALAPVLLPGSSSASISAWSVSRIPRSLSGFRDY